MSASMLGSRGARYWLLLSSLCLLSSCAEGTKVDVPKTPGEEADDRGGGGAGGVKSTATIVPALGGVPSKSGSVKPSTGGSASLDAAQGGKGGPQGGASWGYAGFLAASAAGGAAAATVPAPVAGPAIRILQQKISSAHNETSTDFALVNFGPEALNLATVTVRYYFTVDAWATPVFEIDHAGQLITRNDIKFSLFTIDPPRSDADRYFEISFTMGSIPASGEIQINSRLHEQTWRAMDVANDYSYIGGAGFSERMTVFSGSQLVWGKEPEILSSTGAGGASGMAGAPSVGSPAGGAFGTSGGSGGVAGAVGLAGVAGRV